MKRMRCVRVRSKARTTVAAMTPPHPNPLLPGGEGKRQRSSAGPARFLRFRVVRRAHHGFSRNETSGCRTSPDEDDLPSVRGSTVSPVCWSFGPSGVRPIPSRPHQLSARPRQTRVLNSLRSAPSVGDRWRGCRRFRHSVPVWCRLCPKSGASARCDQLLGELLNPLPDPP